MVRSEHLVDLTPDTAKTALDSRLTELEDDLVDFLRSYVAQPSVNADLGGEKVGGQELTSQRWLCSTVQDWQLFDEVELWEAVEDRPNLRALLRGQGTGRNVLLNGHNDVVPVGDESEWTVPAWGGELRDGKIFGRGAVDMKGGTAAFLFALRALADAGIELGGSVTVAVTSGEESGARAAGPDAVLARGLSAPLCIVAEPTGLKVASAISGELYARLRVRGRAAHLASRPEAIWPHEGPPAGVNAIEKMIKLVRSLVELERDWGAHVRHPAMPPGHMTLNVAMIRGGEFISTLAEDCEAVLSVLFAPSYSVASVAKELEEVIGRAAANDLWMRETPPSLDWPHVVPGKEPVDLTDHEAVPVLVGACATAGVDDPGEIYASFTSDANFFADAGQPTLMFGPGHLSMNAHGPDEYIPVADVVLGARAFGHFLIDWCGLAGGPAS
jgi:acetylornithine deacetylase/succinyl-diaminopimelate desuccinylase family protein